MFGVLPQLGEIFSQQPPMGSDSKSQGPIAFNNFAVKAVRAVRVPISICCLMRIHAKGLKQSYLALAS